MDEDKAIDYVFGSFISAYKRIEDLNESMQVIELESTILESLPISVLLAILMISRVNKEYGIEFSVRSRLYQAVWRHLMATRSPKETMELLAGLE